MTRPLEIKICGITDKYCMQAAIDCKVDYIGLVFYGQSPRNISFDIAKSLLKNRNSHSKIVVLTVDPIDSFISKIVDIICPDFLQLHGNETPERCKEIKNKFNIPIIKGVGIKTKEQLNSLLNEFEEVSDILLLDAPSTKLPGGNGNSFNWNITKDFNLKNKWMLAGGINLSNVKDAIKTSCPPIIDVSSGVEIQKGIKSPKLIKDFVSSCKNI